MMKKKIIFLMAALAVTCGGLFAASINNVSAVKKIPTRYDWLDHHRGENWTGGRTITAKEGAEIVRAAKSYKGRPYNGFVCTQLVKAAFGKTRISPMVNVSKRTLTLKCWNLQIYWQNKSPTLNLMKNTITK